MFDTTVILQSVMNGSFKQLHITLEVEKKYSRLTV